MTPVSFFFPNQMARLLSSVSGLSSAPTLPDVAPAPEPFQLTRRLELGGGLGCDGLVLGSSPVKGARED